MLLTGGQEGPALGTQQRARWKHRRRTRPRGTIVVRSRVRWASAAAGMHSTLMPRPACRSSSRCLPLQRNEEAEGGWGTGMRRRLMHASALPSGCRQVAVRAFRAQTSRVPPCIAMLTCFLSRSGLLCGKRASRLRFLFTACNGSQPFTLALNAARRPRPHVRLEPPWIPSNTLPRPPGRPGARREASDASVQGRS